MPNTQTSVPAFTSGQVLTAAQMTEVNTGIPVFATTTTRDAAFGGTGEKTLAEGQFAYIEASDTTQYYDGAAWVTLGGKFGQCVSTTKTDTFTTTSTSFVDVTGLSVSITPTSTSSKVLVIYTVSMGGSTTNDVWANLVRGATTLAAGTGGSSANGTLYGLRANLSEIYNGSGNYLDSPATTSATTYKIQMRAGSDTAYLNRRSDANYGVSSTITVIEVLP